MKKRANRGDTEYLLASEANAKRLREAIRQAIDTEPPPDHADLVGLRSFGLRAIRARLEKRRRPPPSIPPA